MAPSSVAGDVLAVHEDPLGLPGAGLAVRHGGPARDDHAVAGLDQVADRRLVRGMAGDKGNCVIDADELGDDLFQLAVDRPLPR